MTNHNTATRERNQQGVKDFLALLKAKDFDKWIELWADDGIQEMPYAPPGLPAPIEVKTAIQRYSKGLPKAGSRMSCPDLTIYPRLDPDGVLAEYRGEIDIAATNRASNNRYCALFHLHNGQALFKEYFNPTLLNEALSEASSLGATFKPGR
ncbi:MAG TPA: nuclear transport factor 2 family protein [Candidatus Caenarcaniphilales bacterium]